MSVFVEPLASTNIFAETFDDGKIEVLYIYGFCGFAVIIPHANGGTLSQNMRLWRKDRPLQ